MIVVGRDDLETTPYFRVRPMVRDKMLRYVEVRAPSRHKELRELAAKAQRSP